MADRREAALAEFKRILKWIVAVGVLTVAAALTYLTLSGTIDSTMVIATTFGVFFSVLVGCGLFAAAFFSENSGIDQAVTDVTRTERARARAHSPKPRTRS
ncbi:MAG TPA: hypothetical protein VF079_03295 [Sphingomicrobium sp.]